MKNVFSLAIVSLLALSCTKKTESNVKDITEDSVTVNSSDFNVEAVPEICYMEANGKDSLFMKVVSNLGTVTGNLYYKNFQKDSSFGDIVGVEDGDTLKLDYTFQSEGMESTREIWFLMRDGKVIEGIAEPNAEGTGYKDYHSVKYDGGHVLSLVECNTLEKQFKQIADYKKKAASANSSNTVSAAPAPEKTP